MRQRFGCSAYDVDSGAVFALDSAWVRRTDSAIVQSAESLFSSLRARPNFKHLPPANHYLRQYLGVEREGRRMAYLHAAAPELFAGVPGISFPWESLSRYPISVCDGGSAIFGLFVDVDTGTRTRLEFSDAYSGRVDYP